MFYINTIFVNSLHFMKGCFVTENGSGPDSEQNSDLESENPWQVAFYTYDLIQPAPDI